MKSGLATGTSLADAHAIEPGLSVHAYDAVADADLLDGIADACMRYTPMVAIQEPDGIALDITGVTHLFGGEIQLAKTVCDWLQGERFAIRSACASTAEAAGALARYHRGRIDDEMAAIRALPIIALGLGEEANLGLCRAGLTRLGDVMDRPRKVIAARFGAASIYRLERLVGTQAKPINPRRFAPSRIFKRRFAEPVGSKDYAVRILRELLEEANASLAAEDLGGRAFTARFYRVDGVVQSAGVQTGLPTRDSAAIARLFDERLDVLADPLDPGFGFDSIALEVLQAEGLKAKQEDIEKPPDAGNALAETLDVMGVRLGRNRVLRFRSQDTHIPEDGQVPVPAIDLAQPFRWERTKSSDPPSRPLQLFDPPQRIVAIVELPDGPPRRFHWRGKVRDVLRYEGPERIAAEWWKSPEDPLGTDQLTRDYYRVEDADGRRYWVFRHGLYGRETDDPAWYLHGLFA